MSVVNTSGDAGSPLFKGKHIPYRNSIVNRNILIETYASYLPRSAVITMRKDHAGVESTNFLQLSAYVCGFCAIFTSKRQKVLLVYDGYRSLMLLKVL